MRLLEIRPATPDDAPAIADIHVRAWQWTYRGQVPDDYLDGLTADIPRHIAFKHSLLSNPDNPVRTWVAVRDGCVVGFVDAGESRDADADTQTGEIWSVHVDPSVARQGVGRALMGPAVSDLHRRGFTDLTLWVLDSNERARRFYEALDWWPDGASKVEPRQDFDLHEVRYRLAPKAINPS